MAEEAAIEVLRNNKVTTHRNAALIFFSRKNIHPHSVSSSPQMDIEADGDKFIVDTVG